MTHVVLARSFRWHRAGRVLVVEGLALHPGTFTGIDGHTITYPPELFENGNIVIAERRIKFQHRDDDESVVGFITGWKLTKNGLYIRGYVFDDDLIEAIEDGEMNGLSIEANVHVDNENVARRVVITAVAIVPEPAAPKARIQKVAVRTLLARNTETVGEVSPTEEAMAKDRPSKEEFFAWIEKQLKDAGVEKEIIDTVMEVLKKAIKVPYPYPYPKPAEMEAKVKQLEEENAKLKAELEEKNKLIEELKQKLQEQTLQTEMAAIRAVDPDFKPEDVFEDNMSFEAKLAALKAYRKTLEKRKVRLEVAKNDPSEKVYTVLVELFGKEGADEILRELGGE